LAAWQVLAYPPLFQQDSSDREEEWGGMIVRNDITVK